ncbi:TPA: hypothetical protein ACH3X3_004236 [Trebouxia sp. C0006]
MPVAGPVWTAEEDEMLRRLVAQHGTKKWAHLATIIKSKKSKQCRRRWKNFQDAELKKTGVWTPAEDALLREGHSKYGNKWTEIAKMVGGRTDNAVKNRWASLTKKNPRLANGSPSSVPTASADSSFSGSMPSQSRSAQSNSVSMQPTRLPGTRPSRLRSLTRADDAQPNQMSTSNSGTRSRYQASTESGPTVMTHPHLKGLTVRTHAKSEHGSDGSGSGRTPGSVNIRVWKDSLTPKERQQAQEVNALCLPVTIHLEDQMIPLPQAYAAAGNSEAKDQMVEANGLWRTDTDGDIAKWLNNGFTPRAGESGDLQPQAFAANTPRTQSLINNQQRQLLHKLFSKGSLPSQQQMLSDTAQQSMYYQQQQQQQPQSGYGAQLQYMPQQQLQHQHMHVGAGGQNIAGPFKPGRPDQQAQPQQQQQLQQPMYHITAQAYDSVNYAQQQFGGGQIHPLAQHQGVLTRGQSFALNGQLGMMTRGQSFGQQGVLTRGQSFANGQSSGEQAMEGMIESPRLEVLVTPNFSSQELNMLLEALGNEEMADMGGSAPLQHSSSLGLFM